MATISEYRIARGAMAQLNLTVRFDGKKLLRGMFGLFKWRLFVGLSLMRLGSWVLRMGKLDAVDG